MFSFAFVEFYSSRHAERAFRKLDGEKVDGAYIRCVGYFCGVVFNFLFVSDIWK